MTIQHTVVFGLVHEPGSPAEAEFLGTARATLSAIPGVSDFTYDLAARYAFPWEHVDSAAMCAEGHAGVRMYDDQQVAVAAHAIVAVRHDAWIHRVERRATGRADVDAAVDQVLERRASHVTEPPP